MQFKDLWLTQRGAMQVVEGKAHVDEIVEHFNINAGNPVVCMTQVSSSFDSQLAAKQLFRANFCRHLVLICVCM